MLNKKLLTVQGVVPVHGVLYAWGSNTYGKLGQSDTNTRNSPTAIGSLSWSQVSDGTDHVLGLRSDGTLFAWGYNEYGQLGNDEQVRVLSVIQVNTKSWRQISTGRYHGLAIDMDGALWSWGKNQYGQLGTDSTIDRYSMSQIGSSSWVHVSAGDSHSAAVRIDGGLFVWGSNNRAQLGDETITNRSSPIQIGTSSWTKVSAGGEYTLAIRANDGALFTWGDYTYGQTALQAAVTNKQGALTQFSIGTSYSMVASGKSHVIAIGYDGALWAWGANGSGQIGNNTTTDVTFPVQVGTDSWAYVAAGDSFSLAIRAADGALFAWGSNATGNLGDNSTVSRSSPVPVGTSSWIAVAAGASHVIALNINRTAYGWGTNSSGQAAGADTTAVLSNPTAITGFAGSSFTAVAAGSSHSLFLEVNGRLWGKGANNVGQLALADTAPPSSLTNTPVQVGFGKSFSAVGAGRNHSIAIDASSGALYTWGFNANGQIGDGTLDLNTTPGTFTSYVLQTTLYPGGFGQSWRQISVGLSHTVALDYDGRMWAWNNDISYTILNSGQLGIGTNAKALVAPAKIGSSSWSVVAAGYQSTYAIRTGDGALFAWGDNTLGHLGTNDTINRSSPVQIGTSSWIFVSAGNQIAGAIRIDGNLFTWGNNIYGGIGDGEYSAYAAARYKPMRYFAVSPVSVSTDDQMIYVSQGNTYAWGSNTSGKLGDSSTIDRSSPVQIGSISFTVVSAGSYNSAGIRTDGLLYTWGKNNSGQLASNSTTDRSSPVSISTVSSFTAVSIGSEHMVGLTKDGALWSWGNNAWGSIGDNSRLNRSIITKIGSSSWIAAAAGGYHTLAIRNGDGALFAWGYNLLNQVDPAAKTVNYNWKQVAQNAYHIAAIEQDTGWLYTWGSNSFGALGTGDTVYRNLPTMVSQESWDSVATGYFNTFAIRASDGALFATGYNNVGQLGLSGSSKSNLTQVGSDSWIAVAAGVNNGAAIRATDRSLFTWGLNGYQYTTGPGSSPTTTTQLTGALGRPDLTDLTYNSPVQVGSSSWIAVAVGWANMAAIRHGDYGLWCWGANCLKRSSLNSLTQLWEVTTTTRGTVGDNDASNDKSSPIQIGTSSWTLVSAQNYHVAALRQGDLALFTWGVGENGQLGQGNTTVNRSSPVQIGTSSWTAISAGTFGTIALRSGDFSLWAWGLNNNGNLGTNNTINRSSPVQIGTSSWTAVSIGYGIAALQAGGKLYMSGYNEEGGLGVGDTINRSSPVILSTAPNRSSPVQIGTSSWIAVSASGSNSLAIDINGRLFAWGDNTYGQLGQNDTSTRSSPVQIGTQSWVAVSSGEGGSIAGALRFDGANDLKLFTWGYNAPRLGDNTSINRSSPVLVSVFTSFTQAPKFSISTISALVDQSNYNNYIWGAGTVQIPNDRSSPVLIGSAGAPYSNLRIGTNAGAALKKDTGALYTWGRNNYGQLGRSSVNEYDGIYDKTPSQIGSSSWTAVSVDIGGALMLAVRSGGSLFGWGYNAAYQAYPGGAGSQIARSSPIQIGTSSWIAVGVGIRIGMAITTGGQLYAWGTTTGGQIGNGTNDAFVTYSSPVAIQSGVSFSYINTVGSTVALDPSGTAWFSATNQYTIGQGTKFYPTRIGSSSWIAVGAYWNHTAAIRADDAALFTWGVNTYGDLGDGTTLGRSTPNQVGTSFSWSQVTGGETYTVALNKDDSTAYIGGYAQGQLVPAVNSPSQVGSNSWSAVGAGYRHATGLLTTGGLFAWGLNSSGQVGDSTTINRSSPVSIGSSSYISVDAGGSYTVAIRIDDRALFAWGNNGSGQLGVGDVASRSSPVKIGNYSWSAVSAGWSNTAGIWATNGALYVWGYNAGGDLNLGDSVNRSSPVQSGTDSWKDVSIGGETIGTVWTTG